MKIVARYWTPTEMRDRRLNTMPTAMVCNYISHRAVGIRCTVYPRQGDDAVSEATGDGGIEKANSASRFMDKQIPDRRLLYRMDLTLVGCNEDAVVEPMGVQERYLNYYLAHCPDGITHVPGYASLRYRNIYDNIDLLLHASTEGLKYEFEVRPGGRVEDIRLRHEGTDGIDEQEDGSLHVRWPEGYTREGRPFSYQLDGDELREVRSAWRMLNGDLVFTVSSFDPTNTLLLDPWSTYYGGSR
jgi:hypothetical protein